MSMRYFRLSVLALSLALGGGATLLVPAREAFAQPPVDHYTTPLVVIRFNQPRVYFERQLYVALSRALEAKPSVRFNLVHYYPAYGTKAQAAASGDQLRKVLAAMKEMGLPASRVSVASKPAPDLNYAEVHIYVR